MKKFKFTFAIFIFFLSFLSPTFAATEIFSSQNGGTQVLFDQNGDIQYKTGGTNPLKTIDADVYQETLVDVSKDGKWVVFHKNSNIFLLNLLTEKVHQISLNLDLHYSSTYFKAFFSPNGQYLATEMGRDGIGALEICVYEVSKIDFEDIQAEIDQFHSDYDLSKLSAECPRVSNYVAKFVDNGKILALNGYYPIDIYDSEWNSDNFLLFSTDFTEGGERWKMSANGSGIEQVAGKSLTTPPFSDMTMNDPDMQEILRAMQEGWIQGDDKTNTIRLDDPINRAEFAKVAILALGIQGQEPPQNESICPDVPGNEWYSNVFYTAKQKGAIEGYPQEGIPKEQWLCKPDQTINKVEALKVALELNRWDSRDESATTGKAQYKDTTDSSQWYWLYTGVSKAYNLIRSADGNLNPGKPITRREVIYLINHMRDEQSAWLGVG